MFLHQRIGVLLPLQVERGDMEAGRKEDRCRAERGGPAGVVAVVGDDERRSSEA
jgi:hypothetical protein